jgi:hypothetical protein
VFSIRLPTNVFLVSSTAIVSNISVGLCPLAKVFCPCHVPLFNVAGTGGVGEEGGVTTIITGVGVGVGVGVAVGVGVGVGAGVGVTTRVLLGVELAMYEKIVVPVIRRETAITTVIII